MPKLTFQWNSVPKLTLGAEVHRLVPKLFRPEVTRAEHRLSRSRQVTLRREIPAKSKKKKNDAIMRENCLQNYFPAIN